MADLNPWLMASLAVLPPLGLCLTYCSRGRVVERLIAVQLATSVGLLSIIALTFALGEPSSIDLALTMVILSLPATLMFAVFLERWL